MAIGRAATRALVELQDVTLRHTARRGLFGLRKAHVVAVDRVSLAVQPGEFVGIVGESGSGKSSVARLIVGAERPTAGRILIDGHDRSDNDAVVQRLAREHVQMIFQDPHSALNPRRTVARLLTQAYEVEHTPGAIDRVGRRERALQLLQDVGLPRRLPRALSEPALRRTEAAGQYRPRAVRHAEAAWWPTKSSPASTFRCRRRSSICCWNWAAATASRCC